MSDTIAAALARAQAQFPAITKTRTASVPTKNGGSYTYSYADISDVLTAVRSVLAAEGIAVVQSTKDTEHGCVLVTRLLRGDECIEGRMPLPIEGASPQQVGSLLTYYRRYGLTALVGVAAEDDDDGQAAQAAVKHAPARKSSPRPANAGKPSEKQLGYARKLLEEVVHHSMHADTLIAQTSRSTLEDLSTSECSQLIDWLLEQKKAVRTPDGDIAADAADGKEPW